MYSLILFRPSDAPRTVTIVVIDELSSQSNVAMATVNFNTIDNPPVLDVNGPSSSGNDNLTTFYTEGGAPVGVSTKTSIIQTIAFCILFTLTIIIFIVFSSRATAGIFVF